MFFSKKECKFNTYLWIIGTVFTLFSIVFFIYVRSEKEIDEQNEIRLKSHELSDELRISSDNLTRMARSYVINGNSKYKKKYLEILEIREGKVPSRGRYGNISLELVNETDGLSVRSDKAEAFLERLKQTGFTMDEIAKLTEAKTQSDALAVIEREAMAIKESDLSSEVQHKKAAEIVFNDKYDEIKASVMKPIMEAHQMMDERTNLAVKNAAKIATLMRIVLVLTGLFLFFVILRTYKVLLKINNELDASKKNAQETEQIKADFMANMSHEIRTPLNGIVGFVNLLSKTSLTTDQNKYVSIIQSSIDSLMVIVNDILDFSKITEGKKEIEYVDIMSVTEFEKAFIIFEPRAKDKQIDYRISLDTALNECITIDWFHVKQVMLNLINNALKFTPSKGKLTIQVDVVKNLPEVQRLRFSVRDTGIGIPSDKHDMIFSKFTQVDRSTTRKFGGTGLGLSISYALVEMMGGKLCVESEEGIGSYFYFEIDVDKCSKKSPVVNSLTETIKGNEVFTAPNLNVLVAEDQDVNQMLIDEYLKRYRIKADFANDGEDAVAMAQQKPYDLILMDINMPKMDGIEATGLIRLYDADILIVALTAHVLEGDYERFMEAGMNDYLVKPINVPALEAILRHAYEVKG